MELSENITLGAALLRYKATVTPRKKSRAIEALRIDKWCQHPLAARPLYELRGRDFAAYVDERTAAGKSQGTIRLELAIISHLYNVAIRKWGLDHLDNPIAKMQLPKPSRARSRRLHQGEEAALLAHADDDLKPLIALALKTAMRRGEFVKIEKENIRLEEKTIKIQETVIVGLLSFSAFFMWNASQTLVIHDVKLNSLDHRVEKLEG